jgi:signal transduction histidine kinase
MRLRPARSSPDLGATIARPSLAPERLFRARAQADLPRDGVALAVGLVAIAWSGWAAYNSLATLRERGVPVDWVGLAFTWTGLAMVVVGLVVWVRRIDERTGLLMALCGFLFLLTSLTVARVPVLWTSGAVFNSARFPVLYYLVLAFPLGRLVGRAAWLVMAVVVVDAVGWGPLWAPFTLPADVGCTGCPPGTNLLLVSGHDHFASTTFTVLVWLALVTYGSLLVLVLWRLGIASRPGRRTLAPVYLPIVVWSTASVLEASTLLVYWITFETVQFVELVALALLPIGFAIGLLRARARRGRVGELALALDRAPQPRKLEEAIARALGDPSAEVGIWSPQDRAYLTADQRALEVPADNSGRAATSIDHEGQPIAILLHDPALLHDTRLVEGVAAVARLAVVNEHLAAAVQQQLAEMRASRARIVAASDAERQRVERNLHDGAQQRLVTLSLQLRLLEEQLRGDPELSRMVDDALNELTVALAELRELAQGVHPSVLVDHGLAAALEFLAERAPLPVTVTAPAKRYPAPLEATGYYIAAEALTNVAKYAQATRAWIRIRDQNNKLTIEVADDGIGGADPSTGTGLRGLADRVAAVDGRLEIESPPGGGTKITAELPCA